jgi:DMSO/TMAO reductase YedYZ molybdopterin-dependent catalytic subunit
MSNISRRKLITTGLAATAGASGLAVATSLAHRYGLIPPDHGGIYGAGETLTYAAQRMLTYRSLAREFPRSQISKTPFANGHPPKDEAFRRLQEGAFAEWRLAVDGMVARPASFSVAELKSYPSRSQITHLACCRKSKRPRSPSMERAYFSRVTRYAAVIQTGRETPIADTRQVIR